MRGKYLPVRVVSNSNNRQQLPFRIEGSAGNICSGETSGPTALDIIKNAKDICGYAYNIKDTSFGPYLEQINNDTASGNAGWMYLVNNLSPNVGAADYKLQANDSVLWYFGDFGWAPTRLSLSANQINSSQSATVTVEALNNDLWPPLSGTTVYFGADTATTDSNGQAAINPKDGFYKVYAQKQGYVRSNVSLLKVGQASFSAVNLSVNIDKTNQKPGDSISFTVNPSSIDFGTLAPGAFSTKSFAIANNGTTGIHVESIVSGDAVFTQNLKLNSVPWENFKADIAKNNSQTVDAILAVPADYAEGGAKSGQLTIWAMVE